jgi:hypothetical protein
MVWGLPSTHICIGSMDVQNTIPFESCLISKENVSNGLSMYKAFGEKPMSNYNSCTCQEERRLVLAGYAMSKVNVHESLFRQGEHQYLLLMRTAVLFQYLAKYKTRPSLIRHWLLDSYDDMETPAHLNEWYAPVKLSFKLLRQWIWV